MYALNISWKVKVTSSFIYISLKGMEVTEWDRRDGDLSEDIS